jgi:hypothetical protein
MVDSIFKKIGSVVATNIANEATARQAADTALQTAITAAETARSTAITTEATARQAADTTLTNNLTAEVTARQNADTTLTNNLATEASTRASAITTLTNNLASEVSTRASAVTTLQTNIDGKLGLTATAAAATKLATARTIALTGDVTGSVSFDGTGNASISTTVVNASSASTSASSYQGKEGYSVGALYNVWDRASGYPVSSSSGPWTTYYSYLSGNGDTSLIQAMCLLSGYGLGTSHSTHDGFSGSDAQPGPQILWARHDNIVGTDRSYQAAYNGSYNNGGYCPNSFLAIPVRNTTGSSLNKTLYWDFAAGWVYGHEGSGAVVITPNATTYNSVTNTSHSYVYQYTGGNTPNNSSMTVTIPANTTVIILLSASMYKWTSSNGGETFVDINKIYNLSTLIDGSSTICDLRMLATLNSSKWNLGYTTANFANIWTACARDYGNR